MGACGCTMAVLRWYWWFVASIYSIPAIRTTIGFVNKPLLLGTSAVNYGEEV